MPEQICDLIEKLRHGDKEAFGNICEKYAPLIRTLMAKYCTSVSENDLKTFCDTLREYIKKGLLKI